MEILHPRRILAVSYPDSGLLALLEALTGTKPVEEGISIAGSTHNWPIKTTYYTATVPVWLDEISNPAAWSADFLAPEAAEVLQILGAFVVCFKKPIDEDALAKVKKLLENVGEVVKEGCGLSWDGVCLAVAMPQSVTPYLEKSFDDWEEICQEFGFEFVDFETKGRNEYSEPMGIDRLKEALEANDWEGEDHEGSVNLDDFEDGANSDAEGSLDFGIDRDEMEEEMRGMKQAIYVGTMNDGDVDKDEVEQDEEVEKLQAMMFKMQAVRDLGADMPESERKRFAAKAINDIMKTL